MLFELSEWILIRGSFRIRLPIIYRQRYSTKHPVGRFLSLFPNSPGPLNHFCYTRSPYCYEVFFRIAESFLDLIDSFGLAQHVHFTIHVQGHTLDLVISRKMDSTSWRTDRSQVLFYPIKRLYCRSNLKGFKSESCPKEICWAWLMT